MKSHHTTITTLILSSLLSAALLAPVAASAREGSSSRSVGKGIKCRSVVTTDLNGKVTVTQLCSKGV
jgi:hypothetical protein